MVPCPAMVRTSSYGGRDVLERGLGGLVVGPADRDQLDELPAVVADPVPLLPRGLARDVDPAADPHRPARHREALGVVAGRRADHALGGLLARELHQQVVRTPQLVGTHRLQILALEIDACAGGLGQPFAELQRAAQHHTGNSLSGLVDVGRGQRRGPRGLAHVSSHWTIVPPSAAIL